MNFKNLVGPGYSQNPHSIFETSTVYDGVLRLYVPLMLKLIWIQFHVTIYTLNIGTL